MNTRWLCVTMLLVLAGACAENKVPEAARPEGLTPPPLGSWLMYGGDQGMLKAQAIDEESSNLVLADSTYSLTFQRPEAKFLFVESGKVYYDLRAQVARFTVVSTSGVDWTTGQPRKLALVPETVPFQRDPGTVYGMEYAIQDSLMSLAGVGQETTWFVRAPN